MGDHEEKLSSHSVRSYPFSADRLDVDQTYAELREHEPLVRVQLPYGEETWLVTRHEDARTVLADPRFSRAMAATRDEPRAMPHRLPAGIMSMDPPEHSRLRRLVAKAFTARRVERLRPRARQIADDLLDQMAAAGPPGDLVAGFSLPLPITVICELLGVPYDDRGDFELWAQALLSTTSIPPGQRQMYIGNLSAYMATLVAQRRVTPTDDLLTALVQARDKQDKLSEEEMIGLAVGLLGAGFETTANQIPNFVYVLLTQPDHLAELRRRPELIPDAVEELMRYVPITAGAGVARYAVEDVELSGGTVRAGDPVVLSRTSANRDPAAFADPDRIDLARSPNPHLGFGYGAHHCLGAPLARMELQEALRAVLNHFPGLQLAVDPEEVQWKKGMQLRGPVALPVTW